MFENDNWDFHKDYFEDFDTNEDLNKFKIKKKEISNLSSQQNILWKKQMACNTLQLEFKCSSFENFKSKINSDFNNITSHKNAILDILKNTDNNNFKFTTMNTSKLDTSFHEKLTNSTINVINQSKNNLNFNEDYKNETNVTNESALKDVKSINPLVTFSKEVCKNKNILKRKKNITCIVSANIKNNSKKTCLPTLNTLVKYSKQHYDFKLNRSQQITYSEENILKKTNIGCSKTQIQLDLMKSSGHKYIKPPTIKKTVIRKFPGPAGLLLDDIYETEMKELDCMDKNENRINKYTDICSQNTKNLFSTGAWQLMMNDLPANFELFEIGIVKEQAVEFSRLFKKVPYLAGIVQKVDYKPNDPHIILKDFSGNIDACIHHTIYKKYPNALGTNTVVLVKDVGVLITSKKYICLIISINNLVSIYSDDVRLIETRLLKKILINN